MNTDYSMISDYRCFYCLTQSYAKVIEKLELTKPEKELITRKIAELYYTSGKDFYSPDFSRKINAIIYTYTNKQDIYKE